MKEHILKYITKGLRYDGRKMDEYRPITIHYGVSHMAEGSARVKIGETEVIAGVKLGVEEPYPDTPDQGNLMVNAELTPMSSPLFETGPPGDQATELARVVDRGIRESKAIDLTKLCIKEKEKVWSVMIDICTINDAGNLLDAAALAAVAALTDAVFPEINEEGIVDYGKKTNKKLPLLQVPVEVTVIRIGEHLLVDPLPEEEAVADARLTVAFNEKDMLCAMQKGGEAPLSVDEIMSMIDMAQEKAKELRKKLQR
ncbi:MAG: exosome complex protein Rrp42 [Candidatus Woesearchaeota archaeon]